MWKIKRLALRRHERDRSNVQSKAEKKLADLRFDEAAKEAKDLAYDNFCRGVNVDRALYQFWDFYRCMTNRKSKQAISKERMICGCALVKKRAVLCLRDT